ncbi:MAG: YfiR family protein [Parcubacteria group bacterium]
MKVRAGMGIFGAMALALAVFAGAVPARAASLEYPVKAAFLYKFAPFVEWPATAWVSPSSPLTLCVVGDDPFGGMLDRTVEGRRLGPHPIVVRRLERLAADSGCSIAYIGGSKAQSVSDALAAVQGTPVLTVTDEAEGGDRGIIHFVLRGNRVRFVIDDAAAAKNGMVISSKLMRLALAVHLRNGGRL